MGSMNADPELLELFRAEMDAHLPVLSRGLLAAEKGPVPAQEIEAMMRAAHSIKGAARIVGIEPAVRVSHIIEDCFTAAKDNRIALDSEAVDILLRGVDALQRICTPDGEAVDDASLQQLLAGIAAIRDGSAASPATLQPAAVPPGPGKLVAATVDRDEPSITLPGAWDDVSLAALRREMLDTLALRPARIRLDFAHVQSMSAGGLAVLASFARESKRGVPPPVIQASAASPPVQAILRIAGLGIGLGVDPPG